ncbi:hypothetical protein LMG29542_07980 [Paraburkholderia humisilvae]|uniref:Uncharacterized protein n=1 Tax=Paraburkholderia humisilvae TaxID=627669 RepID=A0A6J5FAA2_9BURK|nr:hypothetical protein LMG29542_07980 [Paraburkholderia humisilvae]
MAQRSRVNRMEIASPNASGIDVGSASHFVSVPPDRDDEPVREFKSFTEAWSIWRIGWFRAALTRWL